MEAYYGDVFPVIMEKHLATGREREKRADSVYLTMHWIHSSPAIIPIPTGS